MTEEATIYYRIVDRTYSVVIDAEREAYGVRVDVEVEHYYVARFTASGVWLQRCYGGSYAPGSMLGPKRFMRSSAHRRFACPSIGEALASYRARKLKQASIHEGRAARARKCLLLAEQRFGASDDHRAGLEPRFQSVPVVPACPG